MLHVLLTHAFLCWRCCRTNVSLSAESGQARALRLKLDEALAM